MAVKLRVTHTRVGFANGLFTARAIEEGQTAKYGADFILTPESKVFRLTKVNDKTVSTLVPGKTPLAALRAIQLEVANDTWKGRGAQMLEDLEASKKGLRDGNKRIDKSGEIWNGYEDTWYLAAKSERKPAIKNRDKSIITEESGIVYSGCICAAIFDMYGNSVAKKKGVFNGLTGVQFFADAEAFGGGGVARDDEFEDLEDGTDDEFGDGDDDDLG